MTNFHLGAPSRAAIAASGRLGIATPLSASAWAVALLVAASNAQAQDQAPSQPPSTAPVQQVLITGNPLGRASAQPASVLTGDKLTLRLAPTLGETLDGLPGVASTWFGPNANRPTIRGLDGDRVRMMDNAGASVDASNLSFDHAVALDPLVVERVEVLRGAASLLYGGSATGGVVNTLDNRIPTTPLKGLGGRAELRAGGAAHERSEAGLLEGGEGGGQGLNWHADAFHREAGDLSVPRFTPVSDGATGEPTRHVRNSAAETWGGALGASWADSAGYLGADLDSYRNHYGVTVEPGVQIHMARERLSVAGERRLDGESGLAGLSSVSLRYGHTRYEHQELEATGEVGTTFRSTGDDLRLEAKHRGWFGLPASQGVLGLQAESLDFSALGEEAFVPNTQSRSAALFALESLDWGATQWSIGLRAEQARVRSEGDAADSESSRFGAASERRFTPLNASLQMDLPLDTNWSLSAIAGSTQRAPAYYELYANGLHLATAAYERGDSQLGLERSTHADLGLAWKQAGSSVSLQTYAMHFSNFIALAATGSRIDSGDGESFPEYRFSGVQARLWGLELEGKQRIQWASWAHELSAGLDLTRGRDLNSGEPLPRIAPARFTLGLDAGHGDWLITAQVRHAWAQNRVPADDVRTPGYTLLNMGLSLRQRWSGADALWFLKLDNLTNQLAYSAGAIRTVRELAPLPGRSMSAGVRVRF